MALATMAGGAAQAAIVNISASGAGSTYVFGTGSWVIEWIGTADGGAYDGWNGACPTGNCASGWRENFTAITDPGPNPDLQSYGLPTAYTSALAALAAYRAAPTINRQELTWNGAIYVPAGPVEVISQPFIVSLNAPLTVLFVAGDAVRGDNFGGVSLRISAAPEPGTWALMLMGFGGAGAALRSRRRTAHAA